VAENVPKALILDETRLRQVLINLVGNAVKFTGQGFVRLACKAVEDDNDSQSRVDLVITVQDSGKGIAMHDQQRIFDAFAQAKAQKISQYGGTGLGLAISRNMVRLMHGTLAVESEPGQGATFCVTLRQVGIAAIEAVSQQPDRTLEPGTVTFEPATVLIADDIDYNREMLAAYLRPWALTFLFATNGGEALAHAQTHIPDLILLDMKMPDMDGYEASKQLKSAAATKHIPIIAVTASALQQDETTIRQYCDGYLRKPVSQTTLLREMMTFLPHTEQRTPLPPRDGALESVLPGADALSVLYESALDGDMDAIVAYLDNLEQQDAAVAGFCHQVRELALGYQDETIIGVLTHYITEPEEQA